LHSDHVQASVDIPTSIAVTQAAAADRPSRGPTSWNRPSFQIEP